MYSTGVNAFAMRIFQCVHCCRQIRYTSIKSSHREFFTDIHNIWCEMVHHFDVFVWPTGVNYNSYEVLIQNWKTFYEKLTISQCCFGKFWFLMKGCRQGSWLGTSTLLTYILAIWMSTPLILRADMWHLPGTNRLTKIKNYIWNCIF